jgi:hypothetical protein
MRDFHPLHFVNQHVQPFGLGHDVGVLHGEMGDLAGRCAIQGRRPEDCEVVPCSRRFLHVHDMIRRAGNQG